MYVIYCSITDLYVEAWNATLAEPAWWTSAQEKAMKVSDEDLAKTLVDIIGTPGLKVIPV